LTQQSHNIITIYHLFVFDIIIAGNSMDVPGSISRMKESPEKKPSFVFHDESVSPIHGASADSDDATLGPFQELGDEVWGAKMFLQSVRTRLRSKKVYESLEMRANLPDKDFDRLPVGWNVSLIGSICLDSFLVIKIALLGPTGAGKSSLIYTLWRAINAIDQHDPLVAMTVETLQVGWSAADSDIAVESEDSKQSPNKQPKAKHGTRVLSSVIVQEPNHEHSQIRIQGLSHVNLKSFLIDLA
jgi:hypothetical protein